MITYLFQVTSIWVVLFCIYKIFLSKEKHFVLNRFYLLSSIIIGLIFPLVQFISFPNESTLMTEISAAYYEPVVLLNSLAEPPVVHSVAVETFNWIRWISIIFFVGMLFKLLHLFLSGIKISRLYKRADKKRYPLFTEVRTKDDHLPFSIFKYIFFSAFQISDKDRLRILDHELYHVTAGHSWDIFLIELCKVFFWWNPVIHLYKKEITINHEFAADHAALNNSSKKEYCSLLLQTNFPGVQLDLGHPFFQTYIKKRIDMIYRKKSTNTSLLKFTLPLVALVFMAFIVKSPEIIEDTNSIVQESKLENEFTRMESSNINFVTPIKKVDIKKIGNGYGNKIHPILKKMKFHKGIDIIADLGTIVYASADGDVEKVASDEKGFGKHIVISHANGYSTLYAHLNQIDVAEGQEVKAGFPIGQVGVSGLTTAPHLHLEIIRDGKSLNPSNLGLDLSLANEKMDKKLVYSDSTIKDIAPKNELKSSTSDCYQKDDGVYFQVDEMPYLSSCKNVDPDDDIQCSRKILMQYVKDNFKYPADAVEMGFQGLIAYMITIDENGKISDFENVRKTSFESLGIEGDRVMTELKNQFHFVPGKCKGVAQKVSLNIPFRLKLDASLMKQVKTRGANDLKTTNQTATIHNISSLGNLGYSYASDMNVPSHIQIIDPSGQVIYDKVLDYMYKNTRDYFDIPNRLNGTYKITVTQDGQTVSNEMNCNVF